MKPIEEMESDAKQKIAVSMSEQWMINKAVHYNEWANLSAKEFGSVVKAFHKLLKSMQCPNQFCGDFLFVSPPKGNKESLRCGCGTRMLNLKSKE